MKPKSSFVNLFSKAFLVASLIGGIQAANAQVNISSLTPYTQNFDTWQPGSTFADNSTIPGVYVVLTGTKTITTADGSTTTAGIRNFGSAGSADRSLGSVTSTGTGGTGTVSYGIRFKNTTGGTINKLIVSYTLEEWRGLALLAADYGSLSFSYRKAATVTSLSSGTWTSVPGLNVTGKGYGTFLGAAALDGNDNKTVVTASIDVNLANGQEVMLRWQNEAVNSGNYLSIDDLNITPITGTANIFYNTYTSSSFLGIISYTLKDISDKNNWNTSPDGTGTAASNFSSGIFIFDGKGLSHSLVANLPLTGTSKMIVAGGELIIPANYQLTGAVDVNDNATLTINSTTLPALGTLGSLSTVNINNSGTTIPNLNYGNLTIAGGKKNLTSSLKVKKKLTLNSKLELGSNDLELEDGATIENASSTNFIVTNGTGKLKQTVKTIDVLFPVGTSDSDYQPVTLSNAGIADVFSVKVIDGIYATYNNNQPVGAALTSDAYNKTWLIDEGLVGGSDVTLTFDGTTSLIGGIVGAIGGLPGFDVNNAKIVHYEINHWDYSPTLPTILNIIGGSYKLKRSGITSFSPYSKMSGVPTPLPVELVSFAAKRTENGIVCNWKTAQELNNDFFTIERSLNGREFIEVGTVKGKGTTSQASAYSFTDLVAPNEQTYYRLKQTDFNGVFEYSKIVSVAAAGKAVTGFELYPNPSAGQATLQSKAEIAGVAKVSILNAQGQLVKEQEINSAALRNGVGIELAQQPAGVYIIRIVAENKATILRMVKQ